MPRTASRPWVLLLPLLVASAVVAGEEPERPGWLVGTWEMKTAEGAGFLAFRPDGTMELGVTTADGQHAGDTGGRWEVKDGLLVVGEESKGEQASTFRIDRLPDEKGVLRARFVAPGGEKEAVVCRRVLDPVPGRPRWLMGTWIAHGEKGDLRMVLGADGRVHLVTEIGRDLHDDDMGRWKEEAGRLLLDHESTPLRIDLLPPEDGKLRAHFPDDRPASRKLEWTRASWLPEKQGYQGPLLGRWDVVGAPLPTAWFFGPYGRYEKRRAFGSGAIVERGAFQVARGATGDVLQLDSDAGHRRTLDLRVEGSRLEMTDAGSGVGVEARRVEGSAVIVAADAIEEVVARADTDATRRFLFDDRRRIGAVASEPSAPRPASPKGSGDPSGDDPAPGDVYVGMEAFAKAPGFRFESEQVLVRDAGSKRAVLAEAKDALARAVPGSARPRVVIMLSFESNGRVVESTETWEKDGTSDPATVARFGKYGLQGDVVLVQLGRDPELRWRLGEGDLFLYRGDATCMSVTDWLGMGLDGPK